MSTTRLGKLCRAVLPANYERVVRDIPAVERFLDENLPPTLRRNLTLLTLDQAELVIGAHSPAVANYLRLHLAELGQQLRESLQLERAIRIRTVPPSLLRVDGKPAAHKRVPLPVAEDTVGAIERSADWIEDESLRGALRDLADALKSESGQD